VFKKSAVHKHETDYITKIQIIMYSVTVYVRALKITNMEKKPGKYYRFYISNIGSNCNLYWPRLCGYSFHACM